MSSVSHGIPFYKAPTIFYHLGTSLHQEWHKLQWEFVDREWILGSSKLIFLRWAGERDSGELIAEKLIVGDFSPALQILPPVFLMFPYDLSWYLVSQTLSFLLIPAAALEPRFYIAFGSFAVGFFLLLFAYWKLPVSFLFLFHLGKSYFSSVQ